MRSSRVGSISRDERQCVRASRDDAVGTAMLRGDLVQPAARDFHLLGALRPGSTRTGKAARGSETGCTSSALRGQPASRGRRTAGARVQSRPLGPGYRRSPERGGACEPLGQHLWIPVDAAREAPHLNSRPALFVARPPPVAAPTAPTLNLEDDARDVDTVYSDAILGLLEEGVVLQRLAPSDIN